MEWSYKLGVIYNYDLCFQLNKSLVFCYYNILLDNT
jgi:hypothetical protein